MTSTITSPSRLIARVLALVLGLAALVYAANPAQADPGPVQEPAPSVVTADALPTVQVDGVVWAQTVVGDTVYAVGSFSKARPAGSPAGSNETPRSNILAYDIRTGALITTFTASLNAQAKAVTASPDGKRIYVGGSFTQANGVGRYRVAAFDATTGALVTSFSAGTDYVVNAIAVTPAAVYIGGQFSVVRGQTRTRFAAFSPADGALLGWNPSADAAVQAMVVSPDGAIIAGGAFQNVNSSPAYGMAKIDPVTGALLPWPASSVVRDAGTNSAILSLRTDGTSIYGSGYAFGKGGNLEGIFKASPTGSIEWVEDCHGDTYDVYPGAAGVFGVNHAHYCGNVGGFSQSNPWAINMRHAVAFTKQATGTALHDPYGYYDWYGTPTPSMINWYPDMSVGTYTGQNQAAWSITGNNDYVVLGGEFPDVNNVPQQGLVRFAVRPIAPRKQGPLESGALIVPDAISLRSGAIRVAWQGNADRDNLNLTYTLLRDNVPVYTVDKDSPFWARPSLGYVDHKVVEGQQYRYRLKVSDPDGNSVLSDFLDVTARGGRSSAYSARVIEDGASSYWPLNEAAGNLIYDNAGFDDVVAGNGVTRGILPGAVADDPATSFNGSTSASTRSPVPGPNQFSVQAWFRTTTTRGGKIVGFGSAATGLSTSYDRHVYMDSSGRLTFGVYNGTVTTLRSDAAYNDGSWHQVTATLSPTGMRLFVDSRLVGQRSDASSGQAYNGFWRIGGDSLSSWPNAPASNYFAGAIDEVAVYPTELTRTQIDAQWVASGSDRASTLPAAPSDAYGQRVFNDEPLLYWRLGEASGSTAGDSGPNRLPGTYFGGVTLGADGAVKTTTDTAATFNGTNAFASSNTAFTNPTNYTEEAWFRTTSTRGGKIIGFGSNRTGTSSSYDRHVTMDNTGKVSFGVYTGSQVTITAPGKFNDGQWHHVVASQSSTDGMKLYLDGALAASGSQTRGSNNTGYWKVGGDNQWSCCTGFLAGTIDEVAVYANVLTASQVADHYVTGNTVPVPNKDPEASFTADMSFLDLSVDASASSDSDGTIASYAWDFGDGTSATGRTATHTYAKAGTYNVVLLVTDDDGGVGTLTKQVVANDPPPNQPPTATFAVTTDTLTAAVDASGSTDPDGSIASYAWDYGDGQTGTGATTTHTYAAAGSYTITLVVTDDKGATATTTQQVTVNAPVNKAPNASFTTSENGLKLSVDGSASSDPDGTITAYAWDFGDGGTATGETATHTYAADGSYTVTLTVTDNDGASRSKSVVVDVQAPAVNQPPQAVFTATTDQLTASFDATASTDPDGSIASYAWDFGDGTTGSGATAQHTYGADGAYTVALRVTDSSGAHATQTSTVTVARAVVARDAFNRTETAGWGTADVGGAWAVSGSPAGTVGNGVATMSVAKGSTRYATLPTLSQASVDVRYAVSLDKAPAGGSTNVFAAVRRTSSGEYRIFATHTTAGTVNLQLVRIVSGTQTTLRSVTVPGYTVTADGVLSIRAQVVGTTSVDLRAKAWAAGTSEPSTWTVTATDSAPPSQLQGSGQLQLGGYVSASATSSPVAISFRDLRVVAVG